MLVVLLPGKKCTYGIKCKFHHPERAKQSNRALADELRESAKQPSTPPKQASTRCSPVPGLSLLSVEDMAKKLTLGNESGSLKNEQVAQVKVSHRSSKKASSRKEKSGKQAPSDPHSVQPSRSQEQLDSGLGSIDSQSVEASQSLCDHQYGPAYDGTQRSHSVQQQFGPPRSSLCSCCSHDAASCGSTTAFPTHSIGPLSGRSADITPYSLPPYPNYAAYPVSVRPYSQPADFQPGRTHGFQPQPRWSDPFCAQPPAVRSLPGERSHWKLPPGAQPRPGREEREVIRKKLLAIFSAPLVDTAMDMFPEMMDPQMLVVEILKLQSQTRLLR